MTKVEEALAEVIAELERIAPIREGLDDYNSLDLQKDSKKVVSDAILLYDNRIRALETAKSALEALLQNGYPDLDIPPVSQAVYNDLTGNRDTIESALAEFETVEEAQSLKIEWGTPEDP
jgi:hypothetical protein